MLVLRRKAGEGIMIGNNLVVRILSIEHGDVKIGIEAPKDVKILREELYKEIVEANVKSKNFDISRAKEFLKNIRKDESNGDH